MEGYIKNSYSSQLWRNLVSRAGVEGWERTLFTKHLFDFYVYGTELVQREIKQKIESSQAWFLHTRLKLKSKANKDDIHIKNKMILWNTKNEVVCLR